MTDNNSDSIGAASGAHPSDRATHEPGLASRPGHSVSVPCADFALRRVLHELELSARVFRDYERQHALKAIGVNGPRETENRLRKARRNGERAASCEVALEAYRSAIATAAGTDETRSGSAEGKGAGRRHRPNTATQPTGEGSQS